MSIRYGRLHVIAMQTNVYNKSYDDKALLEMDYSNVD